jgi:hypothetical protein
LLVLVCLLSFALQNFVAQTHIHPLVLSHHAIAVSDQAAKPAPDKGKTSQDDLACPYCQAAALVGLVLGPIGPFLFVPGVSHTVAPVPEQTLPQQQSPAYAWHSRGPPQH